ncbi:MAG TPA: endonuclease domain-containing protein [Chitinophagaceae bacterium]
MRREMFQGASALIFQRARELRNQTTDTEVILWMHLHGKQLGYKFRRQHPIGNYIVDFYCHQLKLVIEADGLVHNKEEVKNNDKERQMALEGMGLRVVRFTNDEIRFNIERVLLTINSVIHECYQNIGD